MTLEYETLEHATELFQPIFQDFMSNSQIKFCHVTEDMASEPYTIIVLRGDSTLTNLLLCKLGETKKEYDSFTNGVGQ